MSVFSLRNGELFAEDVALSQIGAQFGTPCFVYSRAALEQAFRHYDRAFGARPHLICYAMKANSNLPSGICSRGWAAVSTSFRAANWRV